MSSRFVLSGSYSVASSGGAPPSGDPQIVAALSESVVLQARQIDEIELTDTTTTPVAFSGVSDAHVVCIKVVGSKIKARLTSSDGATQAVPVDDMLILLSESVSITAIDLTRIAGGVATTVKVFLGEKA